MKIIRFFFILFFILFFIISCNKDSKDREQELLIEYLNDNNIKEEPLESGLCFIETGFSNSGTNNAPSVKVGDTVIVSYKGFLLSNSSVVFDKKEYTNPGVYIYKENITIPGWEEAVGYMKKGISARVIIPSELAYGKNRVGMITPYSTLIFDIRVIDVKSAN